MRKTIACCSMLKKVINRISAHPGDLGILLKRRLTVTYMQILRDASYLT